LPVNGITDAKEDESFGTKLFLGQNIL